MPRPPLQGALGLRLGAGVAGRKEVVEFAGDVEALGLGLGGKLVDGRIYNVLAALFALAIGAATARSRQLTATRHGNRRTDGWLVDGGANGGGKMYRRWTKIGHVREIGIDDGTV